MKPHTHRLSRSEDQQTVTIGAVADDALWLDYIERNREEVPPKGAINAAQYITLVKAKTGRRLTRDRARMELERARADGRLDGKVFRVIADDGKRRRMWFFWPAA